MDQGKLALELYIKSGYAPCGKLPETVILSLELELNADELTRMEPEEVIALLQVGLEVLKTQWPTSARRPL